MTFISYAQNFEDVMLQRALKHVEAGFYVDVGANDPQIESVTHAFYKMGWRGINIEPVRSFYESLCKERPLDINLNMAAGANKGELTLYEIPGTGLSSLDPVVASVQRSAGRETTEQVVQVRKLDQIFDLYVNGPIHFLKIDVEGFEKAVLMGLNLTQWRPWIILMEAAHPVSLEVNYTAWEHLVLQSGYQFVYFDGLNRYYLAQENLDLLGYFMSPPNIFDDFMTIREYRIHEEAERRRVLLDEKEIQYLQVSKELCTAEINQKNLNKTIEERSATIFEMKQIIDERNGTISDLNKIIDERNGTISEINKIIDERNGTISEINKIIDERNVNINDLQTALQQKQVELDKVYHSRSYRITTPMRGVFGFARIQRDHIFRLKGRVFPKNSNLIKRIIRKFVYFVRHTYPFSVITEKIKEANPSRWSRLAERVKKDYTLPQPPQISGDPIILSEDEKRYVEFFHHEINLRKVKDKAQK